MKLKIYQVDAFTSRRFGGNPAAVVPLKEWLADEMMQNIAMENNLSETAFFIKRDGFFDLRWFTPVSEVDLCGHATLATGHVLWEELGFPDNEITFHSKSGRLGIRKEEHLYTLDFPTDNIVETQTPNIIVEALEANIQATYMGREDFLVLLASQEEVEKLTPDFKKLASLKSRGVIATAKGTEVDFISRCFFPCFGIDEDPATGSAHTTLAPFWADRLGKKDMTALQLSKRVGSLKITLNGDRTAISGQAVTYLKGEILI